jgi:hypothetical protein
MRMHDIRDTQGFMTFVNLSVAKDLRRIGGLSVMNVMDFYIF